MIREDMNNDSHSTYDSQINQRSSRNGRRSSMSSLNSQEELDLQCTDLEQADFNRLRNFFSSMLNQPMICISTAAVFSTHEMDLVGYSVRNPSSKGCWKCVAKGAIMLQLNNDPELPQEICGAKVIVSNHKSCDVFWSTSLHSWNRFRSVDEHFQVFVKSARENAAHSDEADITRDYAVGIYFGNTKAAKQFNDFVTEYIERVIVYEKRDAAARKEAIKSYKAAKRAQKKADPLRKSTISAPVLYIHTMHNKK